MFKKILLATCLLVTSMASQAALISHYGYERDSTSNIVKGGGLEWLMWDVTKGLSINSALDKYADAGWSLATSSQMAALFNSFNFGKSDWADNGTTGVESWVPWAAGEDSPHNRFHSLFGITVLNQNICTPTDDTECYLASDNLVYTNAWFAKVDGRLGGGNLAVVNDDSTFVGGKNDELYGEWMYAYIDYRNDIPYDYVGPGVGVALVRSSLPNPSPVNTPASFSVLVLGLLVLGFHRRYKLKV